MVNTLSKQAYAVQRKYPFLENFPFADFKVEAGNDSSPTTVDTEDYPNQPVVDPNLVKFVYEKGLSAMTVFIFEQELNWINSISNRIQDLDTISRNIDSALEAEDLLSKRNGVNFAERWCQQLQDNRSRLSYSTSGEILTGLVESHVQLVTVINKIVKLANGKGLVGLSRKEYQIILTYYQFQLIYAKALLGVVISSKISL
jgi:hypothetical protein